MEKSIAYIDNNNSVLESKSLISDMQKNQQFPNEYQFIQELEDAIKKNRQPYILESDYNYDVYYFGKLVYNTYSFNCLSSKTFDYFEKKYNIKFRIEGSTWREGSIGPYPGSEKYFRVR
jgi:hypothetical protein